MRSGVGDFVRPASPMTAARTSAGLGTAAGDAGAPPWLASVLADVLARTLPKGMEFGRYSIDYHYLRNALYVESTMGGARAARHVPAYARALMARYDADMSEVRDGAGGGSAAAGGGGDARTLAQLKGFAAAALDALFIMRPP